MSGNFDPNGMTTMTETQIELVLKNVLAQEMVNPDRLFQFNNKTNLAVRKSDICDALIVRLQTYIAFQLAEQQERVVTFEVYDGWFQAFKAEVWPFLLRWFPLKTKRHTKTVTIERGVVYPSMTIPGGHKFYAATFHESE